MSKEPDFFLRDARYEGLGVDSYRRQFPRRRAPGRELFFEASVGYLPHPAVPPRMAAFDPDLRFVVMVREPAERAYSAWNMYRTLVSVPSERDRFAAWLEDHNPADRAAGLAMLEGSGYPSFAEAMERELAAIERDGPSPTIPAVVTGGLYATHLERYLACFPQERFLVLEDRELSERPAQTLERVTAFLGLPPHDWGHDFPTIFAGSYAEAADERVLERLRAFYVPHNRRLYELAGRGFDWPGSDAG